MTTFLRQRLWTAIALLIALTVVTGVIYPVVVTAVAQVAFRSQANGSFVTTADGRTIGSSLIGQAFSKPQYFWGRPSAAGVTDENPAGYDADASGGSNLGPTNQKLIERITTEVDALKAANGDKPIPVDLVTTSASGLDPDISPQGAEYQVARVAKARNMSEDNVRAAVKRHTEEPLLWFMGQPRVNVLLLNLDLDGLLASRDATSG
jgi:potassium-transporting ATPase KdpC subunit